MSAAASMGLPWPRSAAGRRCTSGGGRRPADGATIGTWVIAWTGRTQREAICAGEREYIGSMAVAAV
jgi:hypothetical protein